MTYSGDMTYEFDIQDCGANPVALRKERPPVNLKDGQCFFIVSAGANGLGSDLAIEVSEKDYYHPRKTGLYNIALKKYKGVKAKNKSQMWFYNSRTKILSSMLHPGTVFFEGTNHNISGFKKLGIKNQKFMFKPSLK